MPALQSVQAVWPACEAVDLPGLQLMHELRAALEERDAQIEKLSSKAEESTAESEQAKQRLMAMRQAGQLLLGKLGAAVLSAQEMKTQARPLEEKLIPIATGAPRAL